MKEQFAIGADIGGSHISCALVDMNSHIIVEESYTQIAVDNKGSADEITAQWAQAISDCLQKKGIKEPVGIGLAMPGPFDYVKGIGLFEGVDKFDHLNGVDVVKMLKSKLAFTTDVPIRFMNDATSFAVGAVWSDDNLASKNVLAITLGTGFGSAFIMDSLPVLEDKRVPKMGCVYHLPFKGGIADDTFSTRGMIKSYLEKSGIKVNGVKDIADKASTDNNAALTFSEFGKELAAFLSPWIQSAEITDIIMGGNVTRAYTLYQNTLEAGLNNINIQISSETDQMAILGSARLADENYYTKVLPLLKFM